MNTIKIAICDDEIIFAKHLKAIISEYMTKKQLPYTIDIFPSGIAFSNLGPELAMYQIIYLDINMEKQDGIETARLIRSFAKDVYIVFVTAFCTYSQEGYTVDATRFIIKENDTLLEKVEESLDAIMEKMNRLTDFETFHFNEGIKELSTQRIAYIESSSHMLIFHVLESDYVTYNIRGKLNDIETRLAPYRFVRIHQSYLVNLPYISKLQNYEVHLINGTTLPSSRAKYPEVRNAFIAFKGEFI